MFSKRGPEAGSQSAGLWRKGPAAAWELYLTSKRNPGLRALEKARGGELDSGTGDDFFLQRHGKERGVYHLIERNGDAAEIRTRTAVGRFCDAVNISCRVF